MHDVTPYPTQIPQWLAGLRSADDNLREVALDSLWTVIFDDGELTETTLELLPSLLAILAEDVTATDITPLSLIYAIAERAYPQAKENLMLPSRAYRLIEQRLDVVLPYLRHPMLSVQIEAYMLLADFPSQAFTLVPHILSLAPNEANPAMRATATWTMGQLVRRAKSNLLFPYQMQVIEWLRHALFSKTTHLEKFVAATVLLHLLADSASPKAVAILIHSMVREEHYPDVPWASTTLWDACDALCKLNRDSAVRIFRQVLERIVQPARAHFIVSAMLGMVIRQKHAVDWNFHIQTVTDEDGVMMRVYQREDVIPPWTLTDLRREALQAVLDCDAFWSLRSNLLACYGVPSERVVLQNYLNHREHKEHREDLSG